ncbi:MAG: hypothetical protein E7035_07735 [Verrucomicrobiaceae bacterium]|nr:hypothetical protein [Verrucomicrobiaceae bacterium]
MKNVLKLFLKISVAFALVTNFVLAQDDISKIDKNFVVEKVGKVNVVFRDALKNPFVLEGFPFREEGKQLRRLPYSIADNKTTSGGLRKLSYYTSGGVVRFRTNAKNIILRAKIQNRQFNMGHMPSTSSSGFDLFADNKEHVKTVNPAHYKNEIPDPLVTNLLRNGNGLMRDYSLYMPLFNGVLSLEIGVDPNAKFEQPTSHKIKKPIVFYGSSITHGACASRTSLCYPALVCRDVDAPMVNLGFAGNAKGEPKMAELISKLDMSVFVYDYDYNAPNAAHLKKTHEKFFKIIRKAQPNLPIIILTRVTNAGDDRVAVIKQTYENALKNGDKNVYFIDGRDMMKDIDISMLAVDKVHPNDTGFYLMYKGILPIIKKILKID